jgi:hypothetical protein
MVYLIDIAWENKRYYHVFAPMELIAVITQHIPEPSFQLTRILSWYSNRMDGDIKKAGREGKRRLKERVKPSKTAK